MNDGHTSDAVVVELSNEVRGPVQVPFRIQALSQGIDTGGKSTVNRLDDSPGESGLEFRLQDPTFPACAVKPEALLPGSAATVTVAGLLSDRGTHVDVGDKQVASGVAGQTIIPFTVPPNVAPALHFVSVRSEGTALTADCLVEVLAGPPTAPVCDIDGDSDVDRNDIEAIVAARNTPAGIGNPRDADNDGAITVNDARICTLRCTKPRCAP